jgi:SAM-dependent methyltransferase
MALYGDSFYDSIQQSSIASAREIVPLVLQLTKARRVVDVGCGTGEWLLAFMESGVEDVLGVDGAWVNPKMLKIPPTQFNRHDLRLPLRLSQSFDLVVCLETAEHLPEACAGTLVESLTGLGPVVLFSGAIPFQGGRGHVNEQWPEYWAAHFRRHRYHPVDCLRRRVWNNPNVACWFAQNLLLFVQEDYLQGCELLLKQRDGAGDAPLPLVHPGLYLAKARLAQPQAALLGWLSVMKQGLKRFLPRRRGVIAKSFRERSG